jgi:hypothetical protein
VLLLLLNEEAVCCSIQRCCYRRSLPLLHCILVALYSTVHIINTTMSAAVNALVKSSIGRLPIPIFGSVATLGLWARHSSRAAGPALGWAFPAVVGGLWFVWPAVDEEWKIEMGFMKGDPAALEIEVAATPVDAPVIELDAAAKAAVENAYKPPAEQAPTAKDIQIAKELRSGVTDTLEKDWDDFLAKVRYVRCCYWECSQLRYMYSHFYVSSLIIGHQAWRG